MIDDAELLRRYAHDQDQAAFAALVERHLGRIYHAALRRTGDPELAKDAAQYVCIVLSQRAARLSHHAALAGWLHTTTRYAVNRALRTEVRRLRREQEAHAMQTTSLPPDPDWDGIRPALDRVLDQLPETDRFAVLLRYFEGRSFAEVGRALQLSEEAARKRVERGIERMRGLLAGRGLASSSAALASWLAAQGALAAPAGLAGSVAGSALTAGGPGLAAGALSSLELMGAAKSTFIVAGAIALLGLGSALYEQQVARQTASAIQVQDRALALQSQRFASITQKAETEEAATVILKNQTAAHARSAAVSDPAGNGREFLKAHPEARAQLLQFLRYMSASNYGRFLRNRGLSPEQIDLMETRLATTMTLVLPTQNGKMYLHLEDSPQAEGNDGVHDALGDPLYAEYQDYQRLQWARGAVQQVESASAFTAPLTAAQADQLTQIIASHSPSYQSGGSVSGTHLDWNGVVAQARAILSADQLAPLEDTRDREAFHQAETTADQSP